MNITQFIPLFLLTTSLTAAERRPHNFQGNTLDVEEGVPVQRMEETRPRYPINAATIGYWYNGVICGISAVRAPQYNERVETLYYCSAAYCLAGCCHTPLGEHLRKKYLTPCFKNSGRYLKHGCIACIKYCCCLRHDGDNLD